MKDLFCPLPWNFQAIRSNGDLRVCCQANISSGQGILRKADQTPYNATHDSLIESRNSELLRDVRKSMLSGQWHSSCSRCQQEEASGLNSRRLYERERWPIRQGDIQDLTASDGSIIKPEQSIQYLDLRFGNTCNLKCRMCGPTDSSAWLEDWVKLTGSLEFKDTHGNVEIQKRGESYQTLDYNWHQSESFWKQLTSFLPDVKHIYMAGGEPLMIKRHYQFLELCVNGGYSSHISLEYNTNLTVLPDKVLELWQKFKAVWIGASIDGLGQFAEYQRHPCKWDDIYLNLKKLNSQQGPLLSWLAFTVTNYNILHICDFMKWKLTNTELNQFNRTKRRPIITHHMAHNPKHLNIRCLPIELKNLVASQFEEFRNWTLIQKLEDHVVEEGNRITRSIESYMFAEDYFPSHWESFCSYTKRLDIIRNQDFLKIAPEFRSFYN